MKKEGKNDLTSFADHLTQQYGAIGTEGREKFEEEFEAFKIGVMIQECARSRA